MNNKAYRIYLTDGTLVIPAGCEKVRIVAEKKIDFTFSGPKVDGQSAGGWIRNLWLDQSGKAWGTGSNFAGQLGVGDLLSKSSPTAVVGQLSFQQLTGDDNNVTGTYFGLTDKGVCWGWGSNLNGQVGDGTVVSKSSPVLVLGGLTLCQVVTTGGSSIWGLTTAGQVYGWGFSPSISGDTIPHSSPVAAVGVSGLIFKRIFGSFGTGNTYFLTKDNKLYGAGVNVLGSLGVGDSVGRSSPVAVGAAINFKTVACAGLFSTALDTGGAAWGWGQNDKGQLGIGNTTTQSTPTAVLGGLTFVQIVSHSLKSSYGLTAAGLVYAWGNNDQGSLGVGDSVARSSPVLVLGLSGVKIKKILTGVNSFATALFLADDGTLYGTGYNFQGELGTGDIVSRSSATAVLGGFKFLDVFGLNSVIGLCDDGLVRAWGENNNGQLGLGDQVARSSPVVVPGASKIAPFAYRDEKVIAVTPGTTYAIKMNMSMVTFGTEVVSLKPYVDTVTIYFES